MRRCQWRCPAAAAYAAVGMGALFVAVVRAPVTGVALVVEMTGATTVFVPLLVACAAALAVPTPLGARRSTMRCGCGTRRANASRSEDRHECAARGETDEKRP